MSGQTIINFDGLSADAAKELANGLAVASKIRIEAISENLINLKDKGIQPHEVVDFIGPKAGTGQCGIGCSG